MSHKQNICITSSWFKTFIFILSILSFWGCTTSINEDNTSNNFESPSKDCYRSDSLVLKGVIPNDTFPIVCVLQSIKYSNIDTLKFNGYTLHRDISTPFSGIMTALGTTEISGKRFKWSAQEEKVNEYAGEFNGEGMITALAPIPNDELIPCNTILPFILETHASWKSYDGKLSFNVKFQCIHTPDSTKSK